MPDRYIKNNEEYNEDSNNWVEYKRLVMQLLSDLRLDIRDINNKLEKQTKDILGTFSIQEKLLIEKIAHLELEINKLEEEIGSLKTKVANIYAIGAGFAFASGVIVMLVQYIWTKFIGAGP